MIVSASDVSRAGMIVRVVSYLILMFPIFSLMTDFKPSFVYLVLSIIAGILNKPKNVQLPLKIVDPFVEYMWINCSIV